MSGQDAALGANAILKKRKRFVFTELTQKDLPMQELLQLASEFASSNTTGETKWMDSAATKLISSKVTTDMILMFPAQKGDEGEIMDDNWALTSNWVYYAVQSSDSASTYIKLLGTMFAQEEVVTVGKITNVNLPEYLLVAKNETDTQGRAFMAEEALLSEEGEKEKKSKIIKNVCLYGIQDLDNTPRECSLKTEGIKRMIKVAGLIRLMGMERFNRLVIDLKFCSKTFAETVQRYVVSSQALPANSVFKSFVKQPTLKGLPVVDNDDTLEYWLLGTYPIYDRSIISLGDFVRNKNKTYRWENKPTTEGRTLFLEAFTNFQKVLVVYYGTEYSECFTEVINILEDDDDILQMYNDSYIQIRFEVAISQFFQDVYKEKTSLMYPEMPLNTPRYCAELLKLYLSEEIKGAKGTKQRGQKWEAHPHSFFYAEEGEYNKCKFTKTVIKKETKSTMIINKPKKPEVCLWHLGALLEVDNYNGKRVECRNKESCMNTHKLLHDLTKKEAITLVEKMGSGKLKSSYETKINASKKFKNTTKSNK